MPVEISGSCQRPNERITGTVTAEVGCFTPLENVRISSRNVAFGGHQSLTQFAHRLSDFSGGGDWLFPLFRALPRAATAVYLRKGAAKLSGNQRVYVLHNGVFLLRVGDDKPHPLQRHVRQIPARVQGK